MTWLIACVVVLWSGVASGATVCREVATGKIVQSQQADAPGSCQQDLVVANPQYGYTASDIEELLVTEEDRVTLLKAWRTDPDNPAVAANAAAAAKAKSKYDAVKAKLGFTDADMANLKAALQ